MVAGGRVGGGVDGERRCLFFLFSFSVKRKRARSDKRIQLLLKGTAGSSEGGIGQRKYSGRELFLTSWQSLDKL